MGEGMLSMSPMREENYEKHIYAAPHVITKDAAQNVNIIDDPELNVIAERFGELKAKKTIEVSLQEILILLPRTRKRSDAYKGLVSKLKRIGVTLIITSNRKIRKK